MTQVTAQAEAFRGFNRFYTSAILDTHEVLTEAISMYRASGYREIPPYDDNPYAHHWFEKVLPGCASSPGTQGPAAGGDAIS
jgi:hypothetical protein